jgi:hypothetical protein
VRLAVLTDRAQARLAAGDSAEAERLATAALALWRGEPYADWPGTATFDEERRRLRAVRATAEAALAEARSRPAPVPVVAETASRSFSAPLPAPAPVVAVPQPRPAPVPRAAEPVRAPEPVRAAPPDTLIPEPIPPDQPRRLLLLALLLVGTLVAAVLAVRSQQAGDQIPPAAEAADLRDQAERLAELSVTEGPLDVSLLLAVQAFRMDETNETRSALRAALLAHPRAERVGRIPGTPQVAMLSGPGPTLLLATEIDVVVWSLVEDRTQPRVLMPIPREWGVWSAAIPSPTDAAFVAAGENEGVPWVRMVSALDGGSRLLMVGDLAGGTPVDGAVTPDGSRVVLLVAEPVGRAPDVTTRWRVVEVDAADGSVRETGIAGTVPFPLGTLAADVANDAGSLVLWNRISLATTLVDLVDGRQTSVEAPPNSMGTVVFRALPRGVAQLGVGGEVTLIDRDGAVLQMIREHEGPVMDAAISPDGTWAVSAGDALPTGELYRWTVDPSTGQWTSPEPLAGHQGAVVDVEIDVTGRRLVSVSGDQTAISWDMAGGVGGSAPILSAGATELMAAACAIVGRDFTPVEWERYLTDRPFAPTCTDLA